MKRYAIIANQNSTPPVSVLCYRSSLSQAQKALQELRPSEPDAHIWDQKARVWIRQENLNLAPDQAESGP